VPHDRPEELVAKEGNGFILIAVIWLLTLGGAIAALLMLRSANDARVAVDQGQMLRSDLAAESAVETVIAELLFYGPRSRWTRVPASGNVSVDQMPVSVTLTGESGKIDINEADLQLIDNALRGFAVTATVRGQVLAGLSELRGGGGRVGSQATLVALLAPASQSSGQCLPSYFTISSGLSVPRRDRMAPALGKALGYAETGGRPTALQAGDVLRLDVKPGSGRNLTALLRPNGIPPTPIAMIDWTWNSGCE